MGTINQIILGNLLSSWLLAIGVALTSFLVLYILRSILRRRFKLLAERSSLPGISLLSRLLRDTRGVFIAAVAVWIGSRWLILRPGWQSTLRIAVMFILLYQAGLWIVALVEHWIARRIRQDAKDDAGRQATLNALGIVAKVIVWTLIILVGLDNLPNVEITSLITGLGIGGIAVGLAVQNILGDLFSSLTIALDKPFVIGDSIAVGEFVGTVEHIGLKSTRVRSISGEQVIFANSDLLSSRIRNYKRMEERRVVFTLRLDYSTPPEVVERVPQLLRQVIEPQKNAAFDRAHLQSYTDAGLQFEVVYLVNTADFATHVAVQNAINMEIYRRFRAEGIEFAHPLMGVRQ